MELLTLGEFLKRMAPFEAAGLVNPADASRLTLLITELSVDHYVEYPLLKFLSRFLSQQSYDEIIEERNIEHQCGYLVCDRTPKQQVRKASATEKLVVSNQYQIYNRKPSMILPNTYLSQYCCKEHYQASIFYRNQLSNEAIFARKDILTTPPFDPAAGSNWYEKGITCLEEVLQKHDELKDQGKSLSDVITMMSGLSVVDGNTSNSGPNELIRLLQDFEIVEKEGGVDEDDEDHGFGESGDPNGIDGYITSSKSFGGYVV